MNNGDDDGQQFLRRAALKGIGHALRRLFEIEDSGVPNNMGQLTSRIEAQLNLDSRNKS
jgi:hypothetical protein